jgi:hypothetical protein
LPSHGAGPQTSLQAATASAAASEGKIRGSGLDRFIGRGA